MSISAQESAFWIERFDPTQMNRIGRSYQMPPLERLIEAVQRRIASPDPRLNQDISELLVESGFSGPIAQFRAESEAIVPWRQNPEQSEAQIQAWLLSLVMVAAWHTYGRQAYVLDPDTAELLALTDLPAVPAGEVPVPFPTFFIDVPASLLWDGATGFAGILVSAEDDPDQRLRSIRILVHRDQFRDSVHPRFLHQDERHDTLLTDLIRPQNMPVVDGLSHYRLYCIVHGFLLYLASQHPRVEPVPPVPHAAILAKNPAKRRKQEQREAKRRHIGYLYVGRGESEGTGLDHSPRDPDRAPISTHWVRGHYRHQPWGPKRSRRRLIWIKPHLRGSGPPSEAPAHTQNVQPGRDRLAS